MKLLVYFSDQNDVFLSNSVSDVTIPSSIPTQSTLTFGKTPFVGEISRLMTWQKTDFFSFTTLTEILNLNRMASADWASTDPKPYLLFSSSGQHPSQNFVKDSVGPYSSYLGTNSNPVHAISISNFILRSLESTL
jgi:hypothetical protein